MQQSVDSQCADNCSNDDLPEKVFENRDRSTRKDPLKPCEISLILAND